MVTAKATFLILSILMPRDQPDVTHGQRMDSFEECWKAAKAFTERDLTEELRAAGAMGLKATCGYQEMPSSQD